MAFGIATAANFKENSAVARLGYDNDAFMCDQFGSGTWVGGAQHNGDVPRTSRINPRTHQVATHGTARTARSPTVNPTAIRYLILRTGR